mmetsp:Transcript_99942/g.282865  ORF Transcript_99942/g.282865 Transcript_99942/m.282865 type:complete len:83 (-) Transcript_99942:1478-1726(-)
MGLAELLGALEMPSPSFCLMWRRVSLQFVVEMVCKPALDQLVVRDTATLGMKPLQQAIAVLLYTEQNEFSLARTRVRATNAC